MSHLTDNIELLKPESLEAYAGLQILSHIDRRARFVGVEGTFNVFHDQIVWKPITLCDALIARRPELLKAERINAEEFDKEGLPFFGGCKRCKATVASYNAYPSNIGYLMCKDCIGNNGFMTPLEFEAFEQTGFAIAEIEARIGQLIDGLGEPPDLKRWGLARALRRIVNVYYDNA